MRAKILIIFMLVSVCAANSPNVPIITRNLEGSNDSIKFYLDGSDERLEDLLVNPDPRVCEDIGVASVKIEDIRRIFEVYGKQAKTLYFSVESGIKYRAQDVFEVLNMLPNLEELQFHFGEGKVEGEVVGTLSLKNLNSAYISGSSSQVGIDFLGKVLPENILTTLEVGGENYESFLNKQRSIKSLTLMTSNIVLTEALKNLNLEKFEYRAYSEEDEHLPAIRSFIKDVINSQPNLKSLNTGMRQHFSLIDDELLLEMSKLSKLESLAFHLDKEGLSNLEPIQNLKNLKELFVLSFKRKSTKLFNQLATFKLESLEGLAIHAFDYDLPKETFEQWSKNLPNLKGLHVTRTFEHSINFFAKTFPQIENFSVKFGSSESPFEFGDAYERETEIVHQNLKKIYLKFVDENSKRLVEVDDFVGFLKMFPNVERLVIESKFPFTAEFFSKLDENLNNIKVLKLKTIVVKGNESFSADAVDALKKIAAKVEFTSFSLYHDDTGYYDDIKTTENEKFTYEPLIEQIKDVYKSEKSGDNLEISAGDEKLNTRYL